MANAITLCPPPFQKEENSQAKKASYLATIIQMDELVMQKHSMITIQCRKTDKGVLVTIRNVHQRGICSKESTNDSHYSNSDAQCNLSVKKKRKFLSKIERNIGILH